jgi:anaerobic selenocysteine-containing dehydrogenase
MSANPSRRDFLAFGGAAIAGVTLGETGRRWLARADERAAGWQGRGVETFAASVCRECPAGCGLRVRLVDDVPVNIEGNPLCPIARGRLCPRGQATIESYYDPDRFVGPAHRVARGGQPRWEPLAWKDAIALAAERLQHTAGQTDGIVVVAAAERSADATAWARMWRAAGARIAWTPLATADRLRPRLHALTGADGDPLFDVERSSYVLSFGAPLADDWLSGVWSQRSFGRLRRGPESNRGRLVQIDGRRSLTARKADEWLAVAPEHQAALAYGIASVLVRESRIDAERLPSVAGTLAAFEHQLITHYTPDAVSAHTGVPVVTILRLARELVATARPLVIVDAAADAALVDAVLALNAVIGAIDRPGGMFARLDSAEPEMENAATVLREIAAGRIKPAVLVFGDSSALRALDGPNHPETLAERVPFVISFSPYVDEAASIADVILPTGLPLESWHAVVPAPASGIDVAAVAAPAVKRRLDTQDKGAALRMLASAMGGAVAQACDWKSSEDLVRAELKRLAGLRRGTPYVSTYETEWMADLESGGWWASAADSADAFASRVLAAGGWVDPYFDRNQLSESLRAGKGLTFPLPEAIAATTPPPRPNVPTGDDRFPIALAAFQPSLGATIGNGNLPALFELLGQPDTLPWSAWVELNVDDAVRLRVADRSRVRISSPHGAIDAVALHVPGMTAGRAALSIVPGAKTMGRWSKLIGADPRLLWGDDALTRACAVAVVKS